MKNCLRLAVFALVVVLFASCGKSPKGIAESRMKSAVDSWVKMRGERKGLVLKSFDVTDKDVIVSNDSVCVMLIHLVISGDRGTDEADVNYIVAKRNDRYSELFIYKKYKVLTRERYDEEIKDIEDFRKEASSVYGKNDWDDTPEGKISSDIIGYVMKEGAVIPHDDI